MKLQTITPADLPLWSEMQCDPVVMAELGGAHTPDEMPARFANTLSYVESGRGWVFKIVLNGMSEGVGSVSLWESEHDGEPISEMGWMVLPRFQGRGLASEAVRATLQMAVEQDRWIPVHAFPGLSNPASNAICRKNGFALLGEVDIDYAGRMLRCNHWVWEGGGSKKVSDLGCFRPLPKFWKIETCLANEIRGFQLHQRL